MPPSEGENSAPPQRRKGGLNVRGYRVPARLWQETFSHFLECGNGRRECQVLWTSSWHSPEAISCIVHPKHLGHRGGFSVDNTWLNSFWLELANKGHGIRVQVHTHPGEAFHSSTDDDYPIVHSVGFLSLVIPNFGVNSPTLERAYLARIAEDGEWAEVPIADYLEIVD